MIGGYEHVMLVTVVKAYIKNNINKLEVTIKLDIQRWVDPR